MPPSRGEGGGPRHHPHHATTSCLHLLLRGGEGNVESLLSPVILGRDEVLGQVAGPTTKDAMQLRVY